MSGLESRVLIDIVKEQKYKLVKEMRDLFIESYFEDENIIAGGLVCKK